MVTQMKDNDDDDPFSITLPSLKSNKTKNIGKVLIETSGMHLFVDMEIK